MKIPPSPLKKKVACAFTLTLPIPAVEQSVPLAILHAMRYETGAFVFPMDFPLDRRANKARNTKKNPFPEKMHFPEITW